MLRYLVIILFFMHTPLLAAKKLEVSIAAESAILINAETGAILFEKNCYTPCFPASITKIATALYTLKKKNGQLNEMVTAEQESLGSISTEAKRRKNYSAPSYLIEQDSSHAGIKKNEVFLLKDLLYLMMVASANDAANVIAQHVGPSIPTFMEELNRYMKDLGCKQTRFLNPHGLHHPDHQTTAYDMAILTKEALKDPLFREIVSTAKFTRPKSNKQAPTLLLQTNMLIREGKNHYSKAIGVKTGHTSHAQNTFVGAAEYEGRTLIAVLLKSKDRSAIFKDSIKLFEAAFNQPKIRKNYLPAGPQKFEKEIAGTENVLKTYTKEDLTLEFYPAEEPEIKCLLYWTHLNLPIEKGAPVAELRLETLDGQVLRSVSLFSSEKMEASWLFWLKLKLGL